MEIVKVNFRVNKINPNDNWRKQQKERNKNTRVYFFVDKESITENL
jgi:hypothetical protein